MRSRSIFTAALVVAVLGSAVLASATGPRFTRYEAVATVADTGQSVQSDGEGRPYDDDGDTDVTISDSTDAEAEDSFRLWADAVGRSDRVLHLNIANPSIDIDTDCFSGSIRVFSETDWFNGGGALGRATLFCDAGPHKPAYFVQWEPCVEITGPSGGPFNFKPQAACIAKVNRIQDGPQMTVELPVPFDITASVVT